MNVHEKDWAAVGVSLDRPNIARIWDYLLGGHHNFAADRAMAQKLMETLPYVMEAAVVQRAFLRRAIDLFTAEGIDQFLDIGSGLPTAGNVHDLARATIPDARVAYVDIDPVVIAHSSRMLADDPRATIIEGDVRYPLTILEHQEVVDLIDFSQPVALTMTSLLHFVLDDELAYNVTRTLVEALAPGSYVAISHGLLEEEEHERESVEKARDDYREAADSKPRRREEILRFFDGLELLEPGLVRAPLWRPEGPDDLLLDKPEVYHALVGVGKKA